MAAVTPDSIYRENMGSLTLHIVTFNTNTINDADAWTSNIPGIVTSWGVRDYNPVSTTDTSLCISTSNVATGQLTFFTGEASVKAIIMVASRS